MNPQYKAARDEEAQAYEEWASMCNRAGETALAFSKGADFGYAQGQAENVRTCIECGAQTCGDKPMDALLEAKREIAVKESRESQFESTLSETMRERDEWKQQAEALAKALESRCKQLGVQSDTLAEYAAWKEKAND